MTMHGIQREHTAGISFLRRPGSGATNPLVLLHGVGSNAKSFGALMMALPPSIGAIAWDAPGYAESAPLDVPRTDTARLRERAAANFLDALELSRAALAGHSLGALFAASFATHYPDRVTALALVSPALGYGVKAGDILPPGVQSRIDEIVELGPAAFAAKRAARLVGDPAARPDVVAAVKEAMSAVHPAGYIQAVRALGAGQLVADAALIAAPALVVVGAQDQITPPANARTAHAALANATGFYEVPNAGHALPQEQPEAAVAGLLMPLIERNRCLNSNNPLRQQQQRRPKKPTHRRRCSAPPGCCVTSPRATASPTCRRRRANSASTARHCCASSTRSKPSASSSRAAKARAGGSASASSR